jgi:uncharacterized Zn finger protein
MEQNLTPEMLKNAKDVTCEACQSKNFKKIMRIKKLSKILTGAPEDALIPIPTFACADCGHVNAEFEIENSPVIT